MTDPSTMTAAQFSAWLRGALLRAGGTEDVARFRRGVAELKKSGAITHLDNFGRFFFTGGYGKRLADYKNADLVSDLLVTTFAHWLRRPTEWVSYPGGIVRSPSNAMLHGLTEIVDAADRAPVTVPGVVNSLRGAIASGYRDWAEAERQFGTAPFPRAVTQSSIYLGARTFADPYRAVDLAAPRPVSGNFLAYDEHLKNTIRGMGTRPVVVMSCDKGYFDRFAVDAVRSIGEQGLDVDVVITVVRTRESRPQVSSAQKSALSGLLGPSRVTVVESRTDNEFRPMTALARFITAADVHRLLGVPVLVMDVDVLFEADSVVLAQDLVDDNKLSFSFNVFGNAMLPWIRVAAGATFVPAGPIGQTFFDVYIGYLARALRPTSNWWIDQNALNASLVRVRDAFPTEPIGTTHPFLASTMKNNAGEEIRKFKVAHSWQRNV